MESTLRVSLKVSVLVSVMLQLNGLPTGTEAGVQLF